MFSLAQRLLKNELFSSMTIMGLRVAMLAGKFLLSLFIARFIGLEALGMYGLVAGAAGIFQIIGRMGVFTKLSRDAVSQPIEEMTDNLRHYIVGSLFLYAVLAPFALGLGYMNEVLLLAGLTIIIALLEHISYDVFILTNNLQRPKLANVLLCMQSASWIYAYVISAFFIPEMRNIETILIFWIIGGSITASVSFFLSRKWPWFELRDRPIKLEWYKNNVLSSVRLYAGELIGLSAMYLDRYLITFILGLEMAGIYMLFWQIANAITNLVDASVIQTFVPRLIAAQKSGDESGFQSHYNKCKQRTLISTSFLIVCAGVVMPFLIYLTDKPLAMSYMPLFWLLLAACIPNLYANAMRRNLFAKHLDGHILSTSIICFFLFLLVSITALYSIGMYGIIVTKFVEFTCAIIFFHYFINHHQASHSHNENSNRSRTKVSLLRRLYRYLRANFVHYLIFPSKKAFCPKGKDAIEIVGFFHSASGIGESARLCARALDEAGYKVRCVSVEGAFNKPKEIIWDFKDTASKEDVGARIIHLNPPMMPPYILRHGLKNYKRVYNIGYWAWELEALPPEWQKALAYINAVFCPSSFTANTIQQYSDKPVKAVLHPVSLNDEPTIGMREKLGIKKDAFVVCSMFSFGSALERKNPYSTLESFRTAFGDDENAQLIFKSNHGGDSPEKVDFLEAIQDAPNVRLIDDIWSREDILGLVKESDLFMSLHRSEGFGLPIAEAMLLGTPVIATNWSGNVDFCNSENSFPINYTMIDVSSGHAEFQSMGDLKWAQADTQQAARLLKTLRDEGIRTEIQENARNVAVQLKGGYKKALSEL